jgi:hypothetical protein
MPVGRMSCTNSSGMDATSGSISPGPPSAGTDVPFGA